jgi:pilus assembly protein Flp/PilA
LVPESFFQSSVMGVLMKTIFAVVHAFFVDEDAVTAIEYALIAAVVGVGVAVAAEALGDGISAAFNSIVTRLADAVAGT